MGACVKDVECVCDHSAVVATATVAGDVVLIKNCTCSAFSNNYHF